MRVKTYSFRAGSHYHTKDASIVGTQLEQLAKQHGRLTAEIVVQDAGKRSSPLRRFFEWDDTAAAAQFRLVQARKLIHSIKVVYRPIKGQQAGPIRAYLHLVPRGERDSHYRATYDVLSDDDLRAEQLERALREAEQWRERYEHLTELADVFAALTRARKAGRQKKRKAS